jgi:quercetin dioxygenase-like cupin family protein
MTAPEAREEPYERGDSEQFTGEVWLRRGPTALGGAGMMVVHFSVGARTHWHMHPGGQFLFGLSGRGRVVPRGGKGHILLPGDIVYAPPGQWHYHGAGPNSPMAHVAVYIGGSPGFGEPVEPVTDKEYDEHF